MVSPFKTLTILIVLLAVVQASAQETQSQTLVRKSETLYKDPLVASYFSATLPGLGQVYTGRKGRGFLFFAGVVTALGSAAAFYEPADLDLTDYDRPEFGGNGDGQLSVAEVKNWEDKKFHGDAFERLSTTRKVGAITGLVTGVGIYSWNVIDAHKSAKAHNRQIAQRKIDLGFQAGPDGAGLALNLHF